MKRILVAVAMAAVQLGALAAVPVWPEGKETEKNGFYRFRAEIDAPKATATARLKATAGYTYRAKVNGIFAGYGPARAAPGYFRVDEWPIALKAGRNVVELEVAGYNCNNFYLPEQTPFVQAEVVDNGKVLAKTGRNGSFAAYKAGRVRKAPRFCYQRGFAEIYRLPETDLQALPLAEQPAKRLLPREWAYPTFAISKPMVAVSTEQVRRDKSIKPENNRFLVANAPNYKLFTLDELDENPHYDLQQTKTVSRSREICEANGWYRLAENGGVVFDAPNEMAGFPRFRARCEKAVTIYFCFDEFLQPDGSVNNFRAETLGAVVWHLEPGEYELEGFEPVAFKCARVLAVGGAAEITAPEVRTYLSPTADRATFRASDPAYEKIFNAARASFAANAVDCFTDCPIRERAGWLGDSLFTARASWWFSGSGRNERLFLDNFIRPVKFADDAKFAGLIPAVWPVDLMTTDCFIPNYDMWLALEIEEYVIRTGDRKLAEAFRDKMLKAIAALDRSLNSDGLLEKLPGWVFVEWSRANHLVQDVNYPSNMMFAKMLQAAARLYDMPELARRAETMRATIRRQSRMKDGWYCDNAVRQADGTLKLSGERTEVCQYYAFFSGVATIADDAKIWQALVRDFGPGRKQKGLWKEIWPANMIFGNCLRMELLSLDGRMAQVARETKEHFLPMAEKTGTLWEHNSPTASCCHGFASIAVEYLYRDVLGIRRIDAQAKTIRVEPSAEIALEWCEGTIPLTDDSTAFVRWHKVDGRQELEVRLPPGWRRLR